MNGTNTRKRSLRNKPNVKKGFKHDHHGGARETSETSETSTPAQTGKSYSLWSATVRGRHRRGQFSDIPIRGGAASRRGVQHETANGERIANRGEQVMCSAHGQWTRKTCDFTRLRWLAAGKRRSGDREQFVRPMTREKKRFFNGRAAREPEDNIAYMCAWCPYTRGRFESTHGFFQCVTPHNTHTPHTTTHTTTTAAATTQNNTELHTETGRQRQRKKTRRKTREEKRRRETERGQDGRQEKRREDERQREDKTEDRRREEKRRRETREDKRREEKIKMEDKTRGDERQDKIKRT